MNIKQYLFCKRQNRIYTLEHFIETKEAQLDRRFTERRHILVTSALLLLWLRTMKACKRVDYDTRYFK